MTTGRLERGETARSAATFLGGVRAGVRGALALAIPVVAFGVSFGVLARSAGFSPPAAVTMSATTFAGAAQFAAAGIIDAGGSLISAIGAAVLLNARYAPMGVAVASAIEGSFVRRLLLAQLVVDESWAIAHVGDGRFDRGRLVGAGAFLYVGWVSSTALGTLGAEAIGDPATLGLDAAFPALFLALLWPQVRTRSAAVAAGLGAAIALILIPLAPPGVPIIAAAGACLIGLRRS